MLGVHKTHGRVHVTQEVHKTLQISKHPS